MADVEPIIAIFLEPLFFGGNLLRKFLVIFIISVKPTLISFSISESFLFIIRLVQKLLGEYQDIIIFLEFKFRIIFISSFYI